MTSTSFKRATTGASMVYLQSSGWVMLKIADAITVIDARLGQGSLSEIDRDNPIGALRSRLADRPHLCDMLERYTKKHALSIASGLEIVSASAPQRPWRRSNPVRGLAIAQGDLRGHFNDPRGAIYTSTEAHKSVFCPSCLRTRQRG
jgi:hypothetical protein